MNVAEQQKAEQELYRTVLPEIVEILRKRDEPVHASERLAGIYGADQQLLYRWIQLTEREIEAYRKRNAIFAIAPLWIGVVIFIALGMAIVAGGLSISHPLTMAGAVVSAGTIGTAIFLAMRLREGVYHRWLSRKKSDIL